MKKKKKTFWSFRQTPCMRYHPESVVAGGALAKREVSWSDSRHRSRLRPRHGCSPWLGLGGGAGQRGVGAEGDREPQGRCAAVREEAREVAMAEHCIGGHKLRFGGGSSRPRERTLVRRRQAATQLGIGQDVGDMITRLATDNDDFGKAGGSGWGMELSPTEKRSIKIGRKRNFPTRKGPFFSSQNILGS